MARHNRIGVGVDQCGFSYEISYQPDWVARVKVTRRLPSGRQSTKVLFRNPSRAPAEAPPAHVRIGITSSEQDLDVESIIGARIDRVRGVRLDWAGKGVGNPLMERVSFTVVPFRRR